MTINQIIEEIFDRQLMLICFHDQPKGWTLHSGTWSPYYLQLRHFISYPSLMNQIVKMWIKHTLSKIILKDPSHYTLVGLATAGIPLVSVLSVASGIKGIFTRKIQSDSITQFEEEIQKYGHHSLIEGKLHDNQEFIFIDDLSTSFGSYEKAILLLKNQLNKQNIRNYSMKHCLCVIDREQGADEKAKKKGCQLHSLIKFKTQAIPVLQNRLAVAEYLLLKEYTENPLPFQNENYRNNYLNKVIKNTS